MRKQKVFFLYFLSILTGGLLFCHTVSAQELVPDKITTVKAEVIEITAQSTTTVPGTDVPAINQTISAKILEGTEQGTIVIVENDYINLQKGEVFYMNHVTNSLDGRDEYNVSEPYRLAAIYFFVGLFVLCVIVFGGKQGIRGLLSLIGSLFIILYVLLPAIIGGYPPVLVSIGVSSLIIIVGSYITHGFSRTTTSAVAGMITTIIFTGALAYAAVKFTRLTGFNTEEAVYLNFNTHGAVNFGGLLLGGIMIGLLGVLYDVSIGQAIAVEELHHAGVHYSRRTVFTRALRIGREHIGALVNTLAIAYVGASLPLLLLYYTSQADWHITLNQEIFATEIIRIMIGSIGLVLAVPITTLISVLMVVKSQKTINHDNQSH